MNKKQDMDTTNVAHKTAEASGKAPLPLKKLILKNVPNILSGLRLLAVPVVVTAIVSGWRDLFFILVMVSLVTDILDGFIARTFKLETEFGAFLDSTADLFTYLCAVSGFIYFETDFVHAYAIWFIVLLGLYAVAQLISFIRFGRNTSYHLYSSKITGYLQGIFFLVYYLESSVNGYFYVMMIFSYLAYMESVVITLFIPALRSNVKGIYFILRDHGKIA